MKKAYVNDEGGAGLFEFRLLSAPTSRKLMHFVDYRVIRLDLNVKEFASCG